MTETYFEQHSREVSIVLSGNEPGSHWRHVERASTYRIAGAITIQSAVPVPDGAILVFYQDNISGFYYGRPRPEFQDGRFSRLEINETEDLKPPRTGGWIKQEDGIRWAVERWNAEVKNRPLENVNRRSLDDTWRQVIRHFGGDPVALCGPSHDDLLGDLRK